MSSTRTSLARPLAVAIAIAFSVATIGGLLTQIGPWYLALKQPSWKPPDWLFGPAWTLIFGLTALAAALAWREIADTRVRAMMIAGLFVNALLNIAWSSLFFAFRRPDWALIEVGLLWLSVLFLIVLLWKPARRSSLLLLPYLAWVSYASVLNLAVVQLNAPFA